MFYHTLALILKGYLGIRENPYRTRPAINFQDLCARSILKLGLLPRSKIEEGSRSWILFTPVSFSMIYYHSFESPTTGPVCCQLLLPSAGRLCDQERSSVCYMAFPDSNSGCMGDTQFFFRMLRSGHQATRLSDVHVRSVSYQTLIEQW